MLVTAERLLPTREATCSWVKREVLDQLLVGGCLFQRGQVLAVQVLHQRPLDRAEVVGRANNRRDHRQAGATSSAPAAFTRDQLVGAILRAWANQYRLQHTDLTHRCSELCQRFLIEVHTRLMRVGNDAGDGQFLQPWLVTRLHRRGVGGDECAETFTESAETGHR